MTGYNIDSLRYNVTGKEEYKLPEHTEESRKSVNIWLPKLKHNLDLAEKKILEYKKDILK